MPALNGIPRVSRGARLRGLALAMLVGAAVQTGCAGYQLALQPTGTPGPLGVRQLPPQTQTQPIDAAMLATLAQAAAAASVTAASPAGTSSPAPVAPQAAGAQTTPEGAAAALTAPPITARPPASSGSTSPAQAASPATNGSAPIAPGTAAGQTSPTAMPSYTATATATVAAPRVPTVAATPAVAITATATATGTPRPPTSVQVFLPAGTSDFLYVGAAMPVDRALAALAGNYDIVYFTPAGGTQVAYRPGDPVPPVLPTNTLVRIGMKKAMSFTMTPAR